MSDYHDKIGTEPEWLTLVAWPLVAEAILIVLGMLIGLGAMFWAYVL